VATAGVSVGIAHGFFFEIDLLKKKCGFDARDETA
jgi:hypothetical protein